MKNEEESRINTAAKEYAMDTIPLTREIWEEAYRDGRRAEYYHQEAVIAAKDKEIERLERWKAEATILLDPLIEYGQTHCPLGKSTTEFVLNRAKGAEVLVKALEAITATYKRHYQTVGINVMTARTCNDLATEALSQYEQLKQQ